MMKYTFGSGQKNADRLKSISDFFNTHAEKLIKTYSHNVKVAVDLGCGPGYTTEMINKATGAEITYGIDMAESFLELARKRCPGFSFINHNVTATPLPLDHKPDCIYARFLLAHLTDINNLADRWADQLTEGGVLILEEPEQINTAIPEFREYLDISEGLVATQKANLYAGRILGAAGFTHEILHNETIELTVPDCRAASWFYPNTVTIWEDEAYVKDRLSPERRKELSDAMSCYLDSPENESHITWLIRRVVLRG